MNYTEIVNFAKRVTDRSDSKLDLVMDDFLRVVESNIRKRLELSGSVSTTTLNVVANTNEYDLPANFNGMVTLEDDSAHRQYDFLPQILMQNVIRNAVNGQDTGEYMYSIIGQKLQVFPYAANATLTMKYHPGVTELTSLAPTNWISTKYPDIYCFGLAAEVCFWAKDYQGFDRWSGRFNDAFNGIDEVEKRNQISRMPLQARYE